ncbi:MAG: hypothetical protein PVG07_07520, partial [Acidobacteriota bacterium]
MTDHPETAPRTLETPRPTAAGSIRVLAGKELQEAFQNRQVAVIAAVTALLLGLGLFLMARDYGARLENYDLIRPGGPDSSQGPAAGAEPVAVVRPNPLSVLARGLDDAMG